MWCRIGIFFKPIGRIERGEEIQESKARCTGPQEEGDEESDPGEEEKETGPKASARSGGSVAAARGRFRRQERRSIDALSVVVFSVGSFHEPIAWLQG